MPIEKLDVGDEGQVSERDFAINLREAREKERLGIILDLYEGREFVWNLLSWCKIFESAPLDTGEIIRFKGRRDVGLYVWHKCFTSSPEVYNLTQKEAQQRDSEEASMAKEYGG